MTASSKNPDRPINRLPHSTVPPSNNATPIPVPSPRSESLLSGRAPGSTLKCPTTVILANAQLLSGENNGASSCEQPHLQIALLSICSHAIVRKLVLSVAERLKQDTPKLSRSAIASIRLEVHWLCGNNQQQIGNQRHNSGILTAFFAATKEGL